MKSNPLKVPIPPEFEHEHEKHSVLVSDLAEWFQRPRPTIETWVKARRLPLPCNPRTRPHRTRTHQRRIYWTLERLRDWNNTLSEQETP